MEMNPTTPVRVKSNEDEEFKFKFERETYVLGPNAEVFWPWNVACHLLGDPTLKNEPAFANADYVRKHAQNMLGGGKRIGSGGVLHNPISWDKWEPVKPSIDVFSMDGTQILMAYQTPHNAETFTTGYTESDMKVKIAQLEQQMQNMKMSMEQDGTPFVATESSAGEDQVTTMEELPEDGGPKTRPRRRTPQAPASS